MMPLGPPINPHAQVNTLVCLGLRLMGLLLLYLGTWTAPPVFAALLVASSAWRLSVWASPLLARSEAPALTSFMLRFCSERPWLMGACGE